MKKSILFLFVFCLMLSCFGQGKYWIHFTDKNDSPYSIERPKEFLSARAIEKRQKFNIAITEEDFPVNQDYIAKILQLDTTAAWLHSSKWLNGVTIYSEDSLFAEKVRRLPFVAEIEQTIRLDSAEIFIQDSLPGYCTLRLPPSGTKTPESKDYDYGECLAQVRLNNIHWLHRLGYSGRGMVMMVMDAGFSRVDTLACFQKLRSENRLLGTRNFVLPKENPFKKGSHGTMVLSCITSEKPGRLIGTAPQAAFYLAKTEDERTENKIEEDNWVAGIEWADSLGVDVLNSSLGYTQFDDSVHHPRKFESLNGKTSRASQAATIAARKGMIICNSAGNEGNKRWHHIGAPADAEGIITVGSTTALGQKSNFSSFGPTADGRVKPDACATGSMTIVANPQGRFTCSFGTSFSSPLLAGMVACLWQAFPDKPNTDIIAAVQQAGNQFEKPDNDLGYGVTDFLKAYNLLYTTPLPSIKVSLPSFIISKKKIKIDIHSTKKQSVSFILKRRLSGEEVRIEKSLKEGENSLTLKAPNRQSSYEIIDLQIITKEGVQNFVLGAE